MYLDNLEPGDYFLRFSLSSTRINVFWHHKAKFSIKGLYSGDFRKRRLLVCLWTDENGCFGYDNEKHHIPLELRMLCQGYYPSMNQSRPRASVTFVIDPRRCLKGSRPLGTRLFIVLSFLDVLRVDAYFFENGEKISVFKNIGIRVDRALQNVSTCDRQLLGDTGTDDIFYSKSRLLRLLFILIFH